MDNKDIETVLLCPLPVMETDTRSYSDNSTVSRTTGPGGYINRYDWRVWNGSGFGQTLSRSLSNLGNGYSAEVSDFGQHVVCRVAYHSTGSGKGVEKTYVVFFTDPKRGDGLVFASSTKWRTISSVSQAVSYITSSIKSYASEANRG